MSDLIFHQDPSKRIFPACVAQPCYYSATPGSELCKKHQKK